MKNSELYVRKITCIGLAANLFLAGIKFLAGILGNSQAVVADAVHSLSDSVTDIAIIAGSFFWSSPPDHTHPHGHERIETFVTLFIGALLLFAGAGMGWHALVTGHQDHRPPPGWIALGAALLSMICKEILYQWTFRAGKNCRSTALTANAWHHRIDALSSIPAFLAVGGAMFFPAWVYLDHVGAIIISAFIIQASFKILWPGLQELLERGASGETLIQIETIVQKHPQVIQIHNLRTRYLSSSLRIDFHLVMSGTISVKTGHDIAEQVKQNLMTELPDLKDVVIHIEPEEAAK